MILIEHGVAYSHSTAALKIGEKLNKPYSWLATAALFVPRPIRDFGYSIIARNRYRFVTILLIALITLIICIG